MGLFSFLKSERSVVPQINEESAKKARQTVEIMNLRNDPERQRELGRQYGFSDLEIETIIKASLVNTLPLDPKERAWDPDKAMLAEQNNKLRATHLLHRQRKAPERK